MKCNPATRMKWCVASWNDALRHEIPASREWKCCRAGACSRRMKIKNKQSKSKRRKILLFLLLLFILSIYSLSWNMFTKDEFDMLSLCSSSIYCRSAPIRYEINPFRFWHISPPARNAKAYRVLQHISSLYISPSARCANHIENPARDLSRCVFSVKDNTLNLTEVCFWLNQLSTPVSVGECFFIRLYLRNYWRCCLRLW